MPSLSDRLKSLGVKIGAQDIPKPRGKSRFPIEDVVDGRYVDTPFGETYVVENRYLLEHHQGLAGLTGRSSIKKIASWAGDPRLEDCLPDGFTFLDTETSGLAGGTGTYAFLIGVGRLAGDEFHLAQYFMRDPFEEPAQLAALSSFMTACRGIVTFNGKSFDVPILNSRFITNGEAPLFRSFAHLDLLPLARRIWRYRLPSRTLSHLEEHILGARRTQEDVPGWMIPQLYFDYLQNGDARPLRNVFYHNAMDILSLAALLNHLATMLEEPFTSGPIHASDAIAVAKFFEDQGDYEEAGRLYALGLEADLPEDVRSEAIQRWSFMEKRRQAFSIAVPLWLQAAGRGELYAFVELAKYFEHRVGEYQEAIRWTLGAIDLLRKSSTSQIQREQWHGELVHRLSRLRRKAGSR